MDVRHPMQIIYTSGTTGDPKGVMIRNNRTGLFNILNSIVWKYKSDDILYNGLSLTHGNAQAVTLFPALSLGVKAVFSPRFTKSRIWDICRKYGCTSFSLLGGMAAGIYNEPEKHDDGDNPVKVVISAGTPMAIWEGFEKRFNVQILEWYGAVEGGFAYKPTGQGPVGSFGKPVPGVMEFKVVDDHDNPVPAGKTGELISRMIRGDTKVDYLGLPEEESQDKTKGGWLRSGDMVHKDERMSTSSTSGRVRSCDALAISSGPISWNTSLDGTRMWRSLRLRHRPLPAPRAKAIWWRPFARAKTASSILLPSIRNAKTSCRAISSRRTCTW